MRKRRTIKSSRTPLDGRIKLLVQENPKRGTAAQRFDVYKDGMLIATYKKKVGEPQAVRDLRWDTKMKFIKIVK